MVEGFWPENGLAALGLALGVLGCRLPWNGWLAAGLTIATGTVGFGLSAVFC